MEGPAAPAQGFLHADDRLFSPDVVVELSDRRQHTFHELSRRALVDRLRDGPERDAVLGQERPKGVVREVIACEPVEGIDHHDLDLTAHLTAVREKLLQLRTLCGLGRLAAFYEDPVDFPALVSAEVDAGLLLGRQAQVLGLFLRRNPAVHDSAHQLTSVLPSALVVSRVMVPVDSVSEAMSTTSSARL